MMTTIVLFFIVFLTSPRLAKRYWIVLVLYTETALSILYIFQMTWLTNAANTHVAQIFGIQQATPFISIAWIHLVILSFTIVQLAILNRAKRVKAEDLLLKQLTRSFSISASKRSKSIVQPTIDGESILDLMDDLGSESERVYELEPTEESALRNGNQRGIPLPTSLSSKEFEGSKSAYDITSISFVLNYLGFSPITRMTWQSLRNLFVNNFLWVVYLVFFCAAVIPAASTSDYNDPDNPGYCIDPDTPGVFPVAPYSSFNVMFVFSFSFPSSFSL